MSPHDALSLALAEAQRIGALGPMPIEESIDHALAYVRAIPPDARSLVDLGSGGGLPGLVVAVKSVQLDRIVLVDRRAKRTDLLLRLVGRLGLRDRVTVETADVFQLGRTDGFAGTFDVVCARSFGTPGALARAAHLYLRPDGILIVSEPPGSGGERWRSAPISSLFTLVDVADGLATLQVLAH